jgi:hypothetical protein
MMDPLYISSFVRDAGAAFLDHAQAIYALALSKNAYK